MVRRPLREGYAANRRSDDHLHFVVCEPLGNRTAEVGGIRGVRIDRVLVDIGGAVFAGSIDDMTLCDDRADSVENLQDFSFVHHFLLTRVARAMEISCAMRRAASAGVPTSLGGFVMGRPMTSAVAPAMIASPGVITRFWSPTAAHSGRTPGVILRSPSSSLCLPRNSSSCGEQMMPSTPASLASRSS